jgi:DNA-binding XRE family transcriptional regulator
MENEYITNQSIILLLAQRVKEYRLAARLSQKEMADSSLSVLAISRVEWREWTRTRSI